MSPKIQIRRLCIMQSMCSNVITVKSYLLKFYKKGKCKELEIYTPTYNSHIKKKITVKFTKYL